MTRTQEMPAIKGINEDMEAYAPSAGIIEGRGAALDLSCKRYRSYTPTVAEPLALLPLQAVAYQEESRKIQFRQNQQQQHHHHHQQQIEENNNNDRRHANGYMQSSPVYANHCQIKSLDGRSYTFSPSPDDNRSSSSTSSIASSPKKIKLDDTEFAQREESSSPSTAHFHKLVAIGQQSQQQQLQHSLLGIYPQAVAPIAAGTAGFPMPYVTNSQMYPSFFPPNNGVVVSSNINSNNNGGGGIVLPVSEQFPSSTTSSITTDQPMLDDSKKALPRPFKAYTKGPLSYGLASNLTLESDVQKKYNEFRNEELKKINECHGGTNIKIRRPSISSTASSPGSNNGDGCNDKTQNCVTKNNGDAKDAAYWERRRKNNEAAKRSRDARRAKEDEITLLAAFFQRECNKERSQKEMLQEDFKLLKSEFEKIKDENALIQRENETLKKDISRLHLQLSQTLHLYK